MNKKILVDVLLSALLVAINYCYQITPDSFMFLVLTLAYSMLLVNLTTLLKNKVSAGLTHVLGANLALNTAYFLLTMLNSITLVDVFTAALLLVVIATSVSGEKTSYLSMYIPVAIVIGVFTGIAIGVKYPLKYSILGILDISLSQLINEEAKREALFAKTLTAIALYTSPIYFTSIFTCLYSLALFILKTLMVNEKGHLITSLDVVLKPLIYGLKPWI